LERLQISPKLLSCFSHCVTRILILASANVLPDSEPGIDQSIREDNDREDRRRGERIEWRERWLVIHEGVIKICKSANVFLSLYFLFTLLILSTRIGIQCVSLSPPSWLSAVHKYDTSNLQPHTAARNLHLQIRHLKEATESVPDKGKRSMRGHKKTRKDELLPTASSPSRAFLTQSRSRPASPANVQLYSHLRDPLLSIPILNRST
jgi:hypothetical protein